MEKQVEKSRLKEWMELTHTSEHKIVAEMAQVKTHFLHRLARRSSANPGLGDCRRVVAAIQNYNRRLPKGRLPNVTLDDL